MLMMAEGSEKPSRYLTVLQVAAQLNMHPETVRKYLRDGIFPGIKVGKKRWAWRISEDALDEYIQGKGEPPIEKIEQKNNQNQEGC
jgi:excisionase family DNA binding protein